MNPHYHREISALLKRIRDFLLGRLHVTNHRYAETVRPRSVPPSEATPSGSPERLSGQQYFTRDPRGQVMPPVVVVAQQNQEQAANAEKEAKAAMAGTPAVAGPAAAAPPAPAAPAATPAEAAPASASGSMGQNDQSKKEDMDDTLPKPGKLHQWD